MPPTSFLPPHSETELIGREAETARLCDALRPSAETRRVVITGGAGVGKSRLLIEAARLSAHHFADGVALVDLAALAIPELVAATVARAVGVDESPIGDVHDALGNWLAGRELLLLLDHVDHLAESVAALTQRLAQAAPRLQIAVAARRPLPGEGAAHYQLSPMELPPAGGVAPQRLFEVCRENESVRLFCLRAAEARPGFALTAENASHVAAICRKLEGNPLALELAAAQLRMITARDLSERLGPVSAARAEGAAEEAAEAVVTAAIGLSFRLLTPPEQMLCRRLSFFAGGVRLETIEAIVADALLPPMRIAPLLANLVRRRLVVADGAGLRFWLPEAVRRFGRGALARAGELEPLRRRAAETLSALIERGGSESAEESSLEWVRRIEEECDGIRHLLLWLAETEPERAAVLAQRMIWPWLWRGCFTEAEYWAQALQRPGAPPSALARALHIQAVRTTASVQFDVGYALIMQALAVADEIGDAELHAHLYSFFAIMATGCGRLEEAEEAIAWLEAHAGEHVFRWERGSWGFVRGMVARARGRQEAALAHLQGSMATARANGDSFGLANAMHEVGKQHALLGAQDLAEARLRESLEMSERTGNRMLQRMNFLRLAEVLQAQERAAEALDWFEAALVQMETQAEPPGHHHVRTLANMAIDDGQWALGLRLYAAADAATPAGIEATAPVFALPRLKMAQAVAALPVEAAEQARALGAGLAPAQALRHGLDALRRSLATTPQPQGLPALELKMLGSVQVLVEGRALEMADWKYARARDLLFYLVLTGERTREEIAQSFWPEADAAAARNRLNVTLHFLRRALGDKEWVRYANGRYGFQRAASYRCDLDLFQALLTQAERLKDTEPARAVGLLERATTLAEGELLADMADWEWREEPRRALRRKIVEAWLLLGELRQGQGCAREAVAAYAEAMTLDYFEEAVYRGLMQVHADRGDLTQLLQVHQHMVELFDDELGAPPSLETTALFERLRQRLKS